MRDQASALTTATDLLRRLAAASPVRWTSGDESLCGYCGKEDGVTALRQPENHPASCAWRQAKEWLAEQPVAEPAPPLDEATAAALLDGALDEKTRRRVLARLATSDDDYAVLTHTAEVLRTLEEDAEGGASDAT